jgi:DNA-binding NarL/FixJ family response regulator
MDRPVAAQEVRKEGLRALIVDHGSIVFPPVPVVTLTSSREEKDLVEGYKIGVNAYVVKPVNFHQFVDAVKALGGFWAVINQPSPDSAD